MNSPDPLEFTVFNEIGIIDQLTTHAFGEVLPRGMTPAQFGILNHFVRLGEQHESPAKLASAFQVSRPTMSTTLARLERGGHVEISPDPEDGRGKLVRITERGRAMREECVAQLSQTLREVRETIRPELFEQLHPLLAELREKLDRMRD